LKTITGCGIYAILNQTTGKGYIGSSINMARRCREHHRKMSAGTHESPKLLADCATDGVQAFRFVVLDRCASEELPHLEEQFIAAFNAVEDGYNTLSGPFSYGFRGGHHRPESRKKMSASQALAGLSERNRRRVWTPEMRQRTSEAIKQLWADPETHAKWTAAQSTPERKAQQAETNRTRTFKIGAWARTSGHMERLAEFHRGRTRSLETREKLSAANRRRMVVNPKAFRAFVEAGGKALGNQRRGKTYEEIYGPERAALERTKRAHLKSLSPASRLKASNTYQRHWQEDPTRAERRSVMKREWWAEHPEAREQSIKNLQSENWRPAQRDPKTGSFIRYEDAR